MTKISSIQSFTLSKFLLFVIVLLCTFQSNAQVTLAWEKNFGGNQIERKSHIRQTPDGGYIVGSMTTSSTLYTSQNFGTWDGWLFKIDAEGELEWEKNYGGTGFDLLNDLELTPEGGYIFTCAISTNFGGGQSTNQISNIIGSGDFWVVKTDELGNIIWEETYGGTGNDVSEEIVATYDGGYFIFGESKSTDIDNTTSVDYDGIWMIKIDANGNIQFDKTYGGSDRDGISTAKKTNDGNFIFSATSRSDDFDVTNTNSGTNDYDFWIVKINPQGNIIWEKSYGGMSFDLGPDVITTTDGGYIVGGRSNFSDAKIIKLDANGDMVWEQIYGTADVYESCNKILQTVDGGYLIGGNKGDGNSNFFFYDYWIFKIDSTGNLLWEETFGGSEKEGLEDMIFTADGNIMISGQSQSSDGDVSGNNGDYDIWILKLLSEDGVDCTTFTNPNLPDSVELCAGTPTSIDAGNDFAQYEWSDGNTEQMLSITSGGTYTVTVTADNGCTAVDEVNAIAFSLPPSLIQNIPAYCAGENAILGVGEDYANQVWSTGSTATTILPTDAGLYSVTVTSVESCTAVSTVFIQPNPSPDVDLDTYSPNSFCTGETINLDARNHDAYLWSDGSETQTIPVNTAGTFSVTVSSEIGCTATDEIVITENALPMPSFSNATETICQGENIVLSPGNDYQTYEWSDGFEENNNTITNAGIYIVTVTNSNNCTASTQVEVLENPSPTVELSNNANQFCAGESILLTAESSTNNFLWSDGSTNSTLPINAAGTYSVVVTNNNGCTAEDDIIITENALPEATFPSSTAAFCAQDNLILELETSFDNYLWSNGLTTPTIEVNAAGMYSVTVTSSAGCTDEATIEVLENITPDASFASPILSFCQGENIVISPENNFEIYLWSDGSIENNNTITNAGIYAVTVSNSNGCTASAEVEVLENAPPTVELANNANQFCAGENLTLTVESSANTFLWSNGSTENNNTITNAGTYSITVTDNNGCTAEDEIIITENALPEATFPSPTAAFCAQDNLTLELENSFDNHLWSNGLTTPTIEVDAAGMYSVTVTNAAGCTDETQIEVLENITPDASFASPMLSFCQGENIVISPENSFETYLWSDGSIENNNTITSSGVYAVTVSNANGCTASSEVEVLENAPPTVELANNDNQFCAGENITLTVESSANNFLWSNGVIENNNTITNAGTYSVTVTDNNGCTATDEIIITENALPEATFSSSTAAFCAQENLTLELETSFENYLWSNGLSTPTIEVDAAGMYSVTVTNGVGCTDEVAIEVLEILAPIADAGISQTLDCNQTSVVLGGNNTSMGNGFTYVWTNVQGVEIATTETVNVENAGLYTLTVFEGTNGCSASSVVEVEENITAPLASITGEENLDCNNLEVVLTANNFNNNTPTTFTWTDELGNVLSNDSILMTNQAGLYTLNLTNIENGCTASVTQEVQQNVAAPNIVINAPTLISCQNENTILDATNSSTGNNFSYEWTAANGNILGTNALLNVNQVGIYTLNILNQTNGCSASESVEVEADQTLPTAEAGLNVAIPCEIPTNGFELSVTGSSLGSNFEYQWTTTDGSFSTATNLPNPLVNSTGIYTLQVTDLTNGCTAIDEMELIVTDGVTSANLSTTSPICHDATDGSVEIDQIEGGTQPYQFSLNNGIFTNTPFFENLEAGNFEIQIQDSNGCNFFVNTLLENPDLLSIQINSETNLTLGETVTLSPELNFSPTIIESINWSPSEGLSCTDCLNPIAQPLASTTYTLAITTQDGCTAEQTISINVETAELKVWELLTPYVQDGENDDWTIFGIENYPNNQVMVFNRWGDVVYEAQPYSNDQPWDGTNRNGKILPEGTYYFIITYDLGNAKILKGRVAILK